MSTFWQDLRYGARMLLKNPGFTVVAVITLSLVLVVQPPRASVTELAGDQLSQSASPAGAQRKAGEVVIEPASLTTPETGTVNFELGTLYVSENRADPKSRIIGVGFARFRAKQPTTAPPTFHLPGGPGDSYLRGLKQENRQLALWIKLCAETVALRVRAGAVTSATA